MSSCRALDEGLFLAVAPAGVARCRATRRHAFLGIDFDVDFIYLTSTSWSPCSSRTRPRGGGGKSLLGSFVDPLQKKNEEDRYWDIRQAGLLTTIPVLLAASPIIGLLIGRWIDRKFDTDPIFSVVFLILGFVAGARQVVRVVKLAGKDKAKDNKKDNGRGV